MSNPHWFYFVCGFFAGGAITFLGTGWILKRIGAGWPGRAGSQPQAVRRENSPDSAADSKGKPAL